MDFISKCTHSYVPFILIYFHYYFMCVRGKCVCVCERWNATILSIVYCGAAHRATSEKKNAENIFHRRKSHTFSGSQDANSHLYIIRNIFRSTNDKRMLHCAYLMCPHFTQNLTLSHAREHTH